MKTATQIIAYTVGAVVILGVVILSHRALVPHSYQNDRCIEFTAWMAGAVAAAMYHFLVIRRLGRR